MAEMRMASEGEKRTGARRCRLSMNALAVSLFVTSFCVAGSAAAQNTTPSATPPLFTSDAVLHLTLSADFTALERDRSASPDRPAIVTVATDDGSSVDIGAELRTRGQFRLDPSNCSFPPLRLDVRAGDAVGTVFEGQDELKFVSSCRPGRDAYEQYVLTEYLAYQSYRAITDAAFGARLLRVVFADTSDGSRSEPRWAFLIEDDEALTERIGGTPFDLEEGKNLPAEAFDPVSAMTVGVFQYMIGNTDWSDVAAHNVEIVDRGGFATAVPFDFDFSGVVNAPYATPNPDFQLDSVTERYYRGWCTNPVNVGRVLALFRDARPRILALWAEGSLLDAETSRRAARYLEAFFDDIETDDRAQRRFLRDCRVLNG